MLYNTHGKISGSEWEDLTSDKGPPVTVTLGAVASSTYDKEDDWWDIVVTSMNTTTVSKAIEDIVGEPITIIEEEESLTV